MVKSPPANAGDVGLISGGQEDPLEKEIATHSSVLSWEIPWTEEPGRLESMGSQRVRHDWVTHTFISKTPVKDTGWQNEFFFK